MRNLRKKSSEGGIA